MSDPVKLYQHHDKEWSSNRFINDLKKRNYYLNNY